MWAVTEKHNRVRGLYEHVCHDPLALFCFSLVHICFKCIAYRHSSIFLTEEEKTGEEAADDDELPPQLPQQIQSYQVKHS
jgi:hypothetical protein